MGTAAQTNRDQSVVAEVGDLAEKQRTSDLRLVVITLFVCALALALGGVITAQQLSGGNESDLQIARILVSLGVFFATMGVTLAKTLVNYYVLLAVQQILIVGYVALFSDVPISYAAVLTFSLLTVSYFEPFPRSAAIDISVVVISFAAVVLFRDTATVLRSWSVDVSLSPFVPLATLAGVAPLMARHREALVHATRDRDQLGASLARLTRANSEYQDIAVTATERAAEEERLRITREIHDIVGYTLTNNIMLLEAALRIMHENVLALPSIIDTARTNAQEGLERVRGCLYELRQRQQECPLGVRAINRLVSMFERATSIEVRCDFNNIPLYLGEKTDKALYHLVQECLVNSYRHGHATRVHISFWRESDRLNVYIDDNGSGALVVNEGIGLQGMRESIESVEGKLSIRYGLQTFQIHADLPIMENRNE